MKRFFRRMQRLCCAVAMSASLLYGLPAEAAEAPTISAKGCVLMDAQTGQVLFSLNDQEKLPMASTTKIMTTLLTLESGDLDTPFIVDSDAIHVEGSSMGLQEGDTVTRRALSTTSLTENPQPVPRLSAPVAPDSRARRWASARSLTCT